MNPYELFVRDVERCYRCALAKTRTRVAVDRGNPKAKIALIGEAPGFHEDQQGLCFVGRAGVLLMEMLEALGLTEQDVYIFNILKCRPPNNEFPKGGIVKECLPHLDRQIALNNPRVAILVGKEAAHYTAFRSYPAAPKMEDLAGRWILTQQFPTIDFLAMYHPAHTLREDNERAFEREYDQSLGVLELALGILDGEQPDQDPLVIGSEIVINRMRKKAGLCVI